MLVLLVVWFCIRPGLKLWDERDGIHVSCYKLLDLTNVIEIGGTVNHLARIKRSILDR